MLADWTAADDSSLLQLFQFAWSCFTAPMYVAGYQTSIFQIIVSIFVITFIFKVVKGVSTL